MGAIIRFWLDQAPREEIDLSRSKYVLYDGTYFHKNGCFISLMDSQSQQTISHVYAQKEGFMGSYKWFGGLREAGLYPCLLYTSPSPRDGLLSRMPSSA